MAPKKSLMLRKKGLLIKVEAKNILGGIARAWSSAAVNSYQIVYPERCHHVLKYLYLAFPKTVLLKLIKFCQTLTENEHSKTVIVSHYWEYYKHPLVAFFDYHLILSNKYYWCLICLKKLSVWISMLSLKQSTRRNLIFIHIKPKPEPINPFSVSGTFRELLTKFQFLTFQSFSLQIKLSLYVQQSVISLVTNAHSK